MQLSYKLLRPTRSTSKYYTIVVPMGTCIYRFLPIRIIIWHAYCARVNNNNYRGARVIVLLIIVVTQDHRDQTVHAKSWVFLLQLL